MTARPAATESDSTNKGQISGLNRAWNCGKFWIRVGHSSSAKSLKTVLNDRKWLTKVKRTNFKYFRRVFWLSFQITILQSLSTGTNVVGNTNTTYGVNYTKRKDTKQTKAFRLVDTSEIKRSRTAKSFVLSSRKRIAKKTLKTTDVSAINKALQEKKSLVPYLLEGWGVLKILISCFFFFRQRKKKLQNRK